MLKYKIFWVLISILEFHQTKISWNFIKMIEKIVYDVKVIIEVERNSSRCYELHDVM